MALNSALCPVTTKQTQARLCVGARGVPHRAAPAVRERLRPRPDRWREDYAIAGVAMARSASSLSGDGEAGPGTAGTGAGRPRLHEEFKRRIKTPTVLPSGETAAMLFWALLASGQINMRKVDGWRTLAKTSIGQPIDLAA
jgi:hypothetical protein